MEWFGCDGTGFSSPGVMEMGLWIDTAEAGVSAGHGTPSPARRPLTQSSGAVKC